MKLLTTLSESRREPESSGDPLAYLWATLSGLLLPAMVVLVGLLATVLDAGGLQESVVRLGTHLYLPLPERFVNQDALLQLFELVAMTFVVALVLCFAVWRHRRSADARAGRIVKALHSRLLDQSLRRAEIEGAAAQHVHAEALIGKDLPKIQTVLSLWYRSIPRSILVFIGWRRSRLVWSMFGWRCWRSSAACWCGSFIKNSTSPNEPSCHAGRSPGLENEWRNLWVKLRCSLDCRHKA